MTTTESPIPLSPPPVPPVSGTTQSKPPVVPTSYATYPGGMVLDPISKKQVRAIPIRFAETKSYVAKSPIHGLGCFAKTALKAGDIIEECSAILLDTTVKSNKDWVITQYMFTWPCEGEDPICKNNGATYFTPTGNALLYNHSDTPNSYWIYDKVMKRIFLGALRDIEENEELTWYYGHGYAQKLRGGAQGKPGGCSSCAKKQQEMEQKRLEQQKQTEQKKTEETNIPKVAENAVEFRSMVVPENTINDTIQDGKV